MAQSNRALGSRQPDALAPNSNRDFWDSSKMHFRLTNKELGVTPTSKVVLGLSIGNGSLVAVKIVKFAPMNLSAMSRRRRVRDGYLVASSLDTILAEVKTMSALRSTKIVGYVTAAVFDERHELFLVMEYVSGGSLHHIARSHQDSRVPLWLARRYLREVLESLKYLHTKGVVHCDIKPQNVLVPDVGPCKLSDFGISRTISEVSPSKWPNNGTPMYMAPEAFRATLHKNQMFTVSVLCSER
ncbi:uncharacterized protein LOC126767295 [Bactrocera neohumeralis]|uniref:uncharacterized protein LOC126767295 n=1 Tax=Bactrocera neohumeralis TaxID=98809 RepID=UPI0021669478|nr:uncharacterized protein LOC126767295 [Bactrocera neohumeralis]